MLHQRSVLLRHAVNISHRLVHLGDTTGLLVRSGRNLANDVAHALDAAHHLLHGFACSFHVFHAAIDGRHTALNKALDIAGRLGAATCQQAHLTGYDSKTTALLTCARGFHRRIQRQDIGLESNRINQADDVANLAAGRGNLMHALHRLLHNRAPLRCRLRCRGRQLVGHLRRRRRLLHRTGQLQQRSHGLLQIAGCLLGAGRQIAIARGNLLAGQRNIATGIAHTPHHAVEIALHGLQGVLQVGDFVLTHHIQLLGQIPLGNRVRQALGILQRPANGHHVQQRQRRHHQRRDHQRQDKQPLRFSRYLAAPRFCGLGLLLQQLHERLQLLFGPVKLRAGTTTHTLRHRGTVIAIGQQLACDGGKKLLVLLQMLQQLLQGLDILLRGPRNKRLARSTHLLQASLPVGMGFLQLIRLLILNDHVLFQATHLRQAVLQLRHLLQLLKRALQKTLVQIVDTEHAEHACAPQYAQQHQHHGNGAQHAHLDREHSHQSKQIHDLDSSLSLRRAGKLWHQAKAVCRHQNALMHSW